MSDATATISPGGVEGGPQVKIEIKVQENKSSSEKNPVKVAKDPAILAREAAEKESKKITLSHEEQEALNNARAAYREQLPSEKSKAELEMENAESDQQQS